MRPTIERVAAGDRFADYCLWDYAPPAPPLGKLRSSSLLWTFLDVIGADGRVRDCCEAFRTTLGPFQTVWGIKQRGGRFSFEFYFYDYRRLERHVSIERVLAGLRPHLASSLTISPRRPYFMFSLDLDDEIVATRRLDQLSLYIGNPGSQVSSGICYNVSAAGLRLDNLYYFFDRRKELDDIRAKVACSAHLDLRSVDLDSILWPALMTCGIVVVANKKQNDGVYFSRLDIEGLTHFLPRSAFPSAFVDFVAGHRDQFDHLLFDVGMDYILKDGRITLVKSAMYGLL